MAVRIRIREGTDAPTKGHVIECIIKKIGQASLTLTPIADHVRGTVKREFELRYTDILIVEYREFNRGLTAFVAGLSMGAIMGFIVFLRMIFKAFPE